MRRGWRRHPGRAQGEVELNLAAMLDMAFQLLAFFILTFKPQPLEGYIALRMPPPQPIAKPADAAPVIADPQEVTPMVGLETLMVTVRSNPDGGIASIRIEEREPTASLQAFADDMASILGAPGVTVQQVMVQVGSRLQYENLIKILDICSRTKLSSGETLTRLSIVEIPES